ncbi:MAG: beta-galactosidase [Bacillota bacterium]|nr:beta-galactosidase [Bacillota bacterium]
MKQNIDLEKFRIVQGLTISKASGLSLKPDKDGYIRLRLEGDAGKLGGEIWDDDKYLIIDMLADMDAMANIDLLFFKAEKTDPNEKNCINCRMIPTRRVKMAIKLDELKSKRYFLPTLPGMLKGHISCIPTSIKAMSAMEIYIHPGYSHVFKSIHIFEIYLSDTIPDMTVIGKPLVDELGQWTEKEWGGKTHGVDELIAYLKNEYASAEKDNSYPEGWSRFGGFKDIRFDKTGYFHTHFDGKRWWLVDPDGYAFFSNGMCYGSRMGVHGFVDKMENLFSWLPKKDDPEFSDAWTTADKIPEFAKRNGIDAGRERYMFNFARANMIRAFGKDGWWDAWVKINGSRLKRWGFNTIGVGVDNYIDERVLDFLNAVKIPFVWTLKNFPLTEKRVFRDFPDVFSDEYAEKSRIFAEQLIPLAGNPYFIGYFVTNEPEWKFQKVNLAERTFASPERLDSKTALIELLHKKYDSIASLNISWNSNFTCFEDLYTPVERLNMLSSGAEADLNSLHIILLKKYASITGDELRKAAPNHMNLGMRYSSGSSKEMGGCEEYDVFSFNRYNPSPTEPLDECSMVCDMPMIIGEWHIGGGDKGLFAHGLLSSPTQEERGRACAYFMQNAMAHKNCVGIHYFEMNDQPLLGRFDGECMQHGVIDICNRPYDELTAYFMKTNRHLYGYVTGKIEPAKTGGLIRRAR